MINLSQLRDNEVEEATATLIYEPAHGFSSSKYKVRFKTAAVLEHMTGADDFACSWRARQKHEKRKPRRRTQRTRSRESKFREDPLNAIRKKVVRNAEQLEALKSSIKMNETLELSREKAYINRRAREALAFLIHRMACELRKPPRLSMGPHRSKLDKGAPVGEQSKQGVTYTRVRIAADCVV